MRRLSILLTTTLVASCQGPVGPVGPTGNSGRASHVVQINATGFATHGVTGPVDDGAPLVACYTSESSSTAANAVWFAVSWTKDATHPYCVLTRSGGIWSVSLTNGTPNWYALFVVVR